MKGINKAVNKVFRMGQAYMNKSLEPYGLRSGLFYFIIELSDNNGLSMQALSKAVGVDNGYTTRAVNKLIELNYVTKVVQSDDLRVSRVFLTDSGREVSLVISEVIKKWIEIVTKDVPEHEIETVNKVFRIFLNNVLSNQ